MFVFSAQHYYIKKSTYNLRSKFDFVIPEVSTVFKGSSSISHYGQIIWSLISKKIVYTDSLESYKSKIRTWKSKNYPAHICKKINTCLIFRNIRKALSSNKGNWDNRENLSLVIYLFIYFFTNNFKHTKKSIKRNQATFNLLKLCVQKTVAFVGFLLAYFYFVTWVLLVHVFVRLKFVCKKK